MMKSLIVTSLLAIVVFAKEACLLETTQSPFGVGITNNEDVEISRTELIYYYDGTLSNLRDGRDVKIFVKPFNDHEQQLMVVSILGITLSKFIESVNDNEHIVLVSQGKMLQMMATTPYAIGILNDNEMYIRNEFGISRLRITR